MNDERILTEGTDVEALVCPDDPEAITPVTCTVVEVRGFAARLRPTTACVEWPGPGTPLLLSYLPTGARHQVIAETVTMNVPGAAEGETWVNLPALPEQRAHSRKRLVTQAAVFPVGASLTDVAPVSGRLEDVSIGGACVHLSEAIPARTRAFVSFRPAQGGLPVRALVEVLSCEPSPDGGYLLRTAFRTISEADRGRVAQTVLALGTTRPAPTVLPTAETPPPHRRRKTS